MMRIGQAGEEKVIEEFLVASSKCFRLGSTTVWHKMIKPSLAKYIVVVGVVVKSVAC